jgi:hypothetical protein
VVRLRERCFLRSDNVPGGEEQRVEPGMIPEVRYGILSGGGIIVPPPPFVNVDEGLLLVLIVT